MPQNDHTAASSRPTLTPRETQIVQLAQLGYKNSEIAASLAVSTAAIKFHLSSIYRKLGVGNRTGAVVAYLTLTAKDLA